MGDPTTDSDPLAETAAADGSQPRARAVDATATNAPSEPRAAPAGPGEVPRTIGRYQIQGELGRGAMGVVFAAHDPDLDRRVAVKVLQSVGSEAAHSRLLREARAMARLSHPAVVTVHEVKTVDGVDYVAMELIDGTTLGEWIATAKPDDREILEAFEAAGRGLAAAHAAGLVHRDFKPHNVLRSKRGRIVVTDFGLAREERAAAAATATASGGVRAPADAGSLASTLTMTGAVLGTPAYMAPEQHDGLSVGPAADQFAYCVAVWEALAGQRPFEAPTLAGVRDQIERGPAASGEAKIPRRVRAALRRGLSVDPDARFPTMDALLAALRPRAGRWWAIGGVTAVVAASIAIVVVTRSRAPAALPGCGPAETELAGFRRAPARAALANDPSGRELVASLDRYGTDWVAAQRKVCADRRAPDHARRVTCLRAVRADLERGLAVIAALAPAELEAADIIEGIGDPVACTAPRPPNRVVVDSPAAVAMATTMFSHAGHDHAVADPGLDQPCLRVHYLMTRLKDWQQTSLDEHRTVIADAGEAADRCGDDTLAAGVTVTEISTDIQGLLRDPGGARRVAAAVERSGGDRFLALVTDLVDGVVARLRGDVDLAIAEMSAAAAAASALGARVFVGQTTALAAGWLLERSAPGDAATAEAMVREALALHGPIGRAELQRRLFLALDYQDRHAEALAVAAEIHDDPAPPPPGSFAMVGRVVDAAGRPVAGARVVAQERVVVWPDALDPIAPADRVAVTRADGTFSLAAVPAGAAVMAVIGDRRARPVVAAPTVELALAPTGTVTGTMTTAGTGLGKVRVVVQLAPPLDDVEFVAPIAADGSWRVDGIPRGKATVVAVYGADKPRFRQVEVAVGATPAGPVAFALAEAGAPLHVIVRPQVETVLSLGITFLIRGKTTAKLLRDLNDVRADMARAQAFPAPPDLADGPVKAAVLPGDIVATYPRVEPGEVTVCALATTGDISDQQYMERFERHAADQAVACSTAVVTTPDQVLVVEVPPMKRLPED